MAKRRKKSKGRRRGGRRRGKKGRKVGPKPGIAETVGVATTAYKGVFEPGPYGASAYEYLKGSKGVPLGARAKHTVESIVGGGKENIKYALGGVLISHAGEIPLVGKMLRPLKRKVDRIMVQWTGMKL